MTEGPWSGWRGNWQILSQDDDGRFTVPSFTEEAPTLARILLERTDQRDQARRWAMALEQRLAEVRAAAEKAPDVWTREVLSALIDAPFEVES